jgi:hypothetical protein
MAARESSSFSGADRKHGSGGAGGAGGAGGGGGAPPLPPSPPPSLPGAGPYSLLSGGAWGSIGPKRPFAGGGGGDSDPDDDEDELKAQLNGDVAQDAVNLMIEKRRTSGKPIYSKGRGLPCMEQNPIVMTVAVAFDEFVRRKANPRPFTPLGAKEDYWLIEGDLLWAYENDGTNTRMGSNGVADLPVWSCSNTLHPNTRVRFVGQNKNKSLDGVPGKELDLVTALVAGTITAINTGWMNFDPGDAICFTLIPFCTHSSAGARGGGDDRKMPMVVQHGEATRFTPTLLKYNERDQVAAKQRVEDAVRAAMLAAITSMSPTDLEGASAHELMFTAVAKGNDKHWADRSIMPFTMPLQMFGRFYSLQLVLRAIGYTNAVAQLANAQKMLEQLQNEFTNMFPLSHKDEDLGDELYMVVAGSDAPLLAACLEPTTAAAAAERTLRVTIPTLIDQRLSSLLLEQARWVRTHCIGKCTKGGVSGSRFDMLIGYAHFG